MNHDKRKYYTSLNSCKGPPSFEEELNLASVSSVASDNTISEFNNYILIYTHDSDDGSEKPYSPSGM